MIMVYQQTQYQPQQYQPQLQPQYQQQYTPQRDNSSIYYGISLAAALGIGSFAYYYMTNYKTAFQLVSEIGHVLNNEDIRSITKQMFNKTFVKYQTQTGVTIWSSQDLGSQVKRMILLNPVLDEESIETNIEDSLLVTYTLAGEYPIFVYIEDAI
jgi:hypothetical protein